MRGRPLYLESTPSDTRTRRPWDLRRQRAGRGSATLGLAQPPIRSPKEGHAGSVVGEVKVAGLRGGIVASAHQRRFSCPVTLGLGHRERRQGRQWWFPGWACMTLYPCGGGSAYSSAPDSPTRRDLCQSLVQRTRTIIVARGDVPVLGQLTPAVSASAAENVHGFRG